MWDDLERHPIRTNSGGSQDAYWWSMMNGYRMRAQCVIYCQCQGESGEGTYGLISSVVLQKTRRFANRVELLPREEHDKLETSLASQSPWNPCEGKLVALSYVTLKFLQNVNACMSWLYLLLCAVSVSQSCYTGLFCFFKCKYNRPKSNLVRCNKQLC